jgi:hypothetical protein
VIQLHDSAPAALIEMFTVNQQHVQPSRKYSRLQMYPQLVPHRVSLLSANEIRLIWVLVGSRTAPKLERVLETLEQFVPIGAPRVRDEPNVNIDNQIALLAAWGLPEEAAKMLCRHRDMKPREALEFARQLMQNAPS